MQSIKHDIVPETQWVEQAKERVDDSENNTRAHLMAHKGVMFEEMDIMALTNSLGISVASVMIASGNIPFTDNESRYLEFDSGGFMEALLAVDKGFTFTHPDVLKLSDERGVTIAHHMAGRGHYFITADTLVLTDNNGISVADYVYKTVPQAPGRQEKYLKH